MQIPKIACNIEVYCLVNPSEDAYKVEQCVSNILVDIDIETNENSLKATSKNLDSLSEIHDIVHSHHSQSAYRRNLKKNLDGETTWFYLNKQAALVGSVALCSEAEESPLGPIKIILRSKDLERVIEWLFSNSE